MFFAWLARFVTAFGVLEDPFGDLWRHFWGSVGQSQHVVRQRGDKPAVHHALADRLDYVTVADVPGSSPEIRSTSDDHRRAAHRYLIRRAEGFENGIHHAAGRQVIEHDRCRPIDDNAGAMRWNR